MQYLQPCNYNLNQRWQVRKNGEKIYYENIGTPEKCIDNSQSEPEKIIAYKCNNGANQQFLKELTPDDNKYLSTMESSLIEEIWKYIPGTVSE